MVRIRLGAEEIALSWEEWEERVRAGRVPPEALVSAKALTGEAWLPAGELEAWKSLRDDAGVAWRRDLVAGGPPILTALLVGVQIRIWWWQWLPAVEFQALSRFLKSTPSILENGEVWRLASMGFLHNAFDHIFSNMLFLTYTAWSLERALGRANLAVLYLSSVVVGSTLSMAFSPWTPSLGASGGVFGCVAAVVVFGVTRPELLPERGRRMFGIALLPYLLLSFMNGLQNERTDNWAHFGGLVTGVVLALVLDPEPFQRRTGWNRSARVAILGILAALHVGLFALGPRISPLVTESEAVWQAMLRSSRGRVEPVRPEVDPAATLAFEVPAGWARKSGSSGTLGFGSPAGDRLWSVREERHELPAKPEILAEAWLTKVRRAFPEAAGSALAPATVAGQPGVIMTVELPKAHIEWRAVVKGTFSVEEVWEVEPAYASRLAPLRDRLRAAVIWREAPEIAVARQTAATAPESRRVQAKLADALAAVGESEEALRIRRRLVEETPEDGDAWIGLLRLTRWYPEAAPDRLELRDRALSLHPAPDVIVEVTEGLRAEGRGDVAAALLDIAWAAAPGDRTLRKARRYADLSVELEPERHLPWDVRFDPDTGLPRRDEEIAALTTRPATIAAAEALAVEQAGRRDRAAQMALDGLAQGRWEALTEGLIRLEHGRIPEDGAAAVAGAAEHLKTVAAGGRPSWMPVPVQQALSTALIADPNLAGKLALAP